MKKILTVIIIGLLCLSTFSILAPQVKALGITTDFESGLGGWQPFTQYGGIAQLSTTYAHSGTHSVEQSGDSSGSDPLSSVGGIRFPVSSVLNQYELSLWVYVTERSNANAASLFGFAYGSEFVSWNPWGSGSSYVYVRQSEGYQTKGDWYNPVPYGLTLNAWHQVKATVYTNLGTVSIWLDGSLIVDNWPAFNAGEKPDYYDIECSANYYGTFVMHQYIDDVYISEVTLANQRVGYWEFDEGSGNTAYDSSGNGNQGALVGGPQWVSGVKGSALSFDGIASHVDIPSSPSLVIHGNQVSAEMWIKPAITLDSTTPTMDPLIKGNEYTFSINHDINDGKIWFHIGIVTPGYFRMPSVGTVTNQWTANTWYYIAGTYDGVSLKIYVNGILENSIPESGNLWTQEPDYEEYPLSIAAYTIGPGHHGHLFFFNGAIDEVRIYNYARTAEEIWNDYISGSGPYENYARLAEGRADAYGRYAQAVYYYSAESTVDFSTQLVQQAFIELAPIYADLLELELAENVLSATEATYNTIVDFKDYLDVLTDPLIEVINRFVYGAYASQTYSYLTSLESLCRQEADAWRSGDLDAVNSILTQEKEAIIPPMGAIPYALGFRRSAYGVDENAYEIADATIDFLNRETVEIATLQSIAKQKPGILASLHSPADLHVFDNQGHHVGAIYDEQGMVIDIETQIVDSYYSGPELEPEFLALLNSIGKNYTFEVIGRGEENPSICTLSFISWDSEGNFIEGLNLAGEITEGETWVYHIQATEERILIELSAKTDIDPNTLNIWSKGVYVTSYLELPGGFSVGDIDVATILLNGTISVDLSGPTAIGDYDNDGIPDLMVKFDRAEVISYILANVNMPELTEKRSMTITLTMTGNLNDGTSFIGSDTIRITAFATMESI